MWTKSEAAGASEQALWNDVATVSGGAILVLAVIATIYFLAPFLFSRRTNPFWEALLSPVLLVFQWLGIILPARGPWRRYLYQPGHLAHA